MLRNITNARLSRPVCRHLRFFSSDGKDNDDKDKDDKAKDTSDNHDEIKKTKTSFLFREENSKDNLNQLKNIFANIEPTEMNMHPIFGEASETTNEDEDDFSEEEENEAVEYMEDHGVKVVEDQEVYEDLMKSVDIPEIQAWQDMQEFEVYQPSDLNWKKPSEFAKNDRAGLDRRTFPSEDFRKSNQDPLELALNPDLLRLFISPVGRIQPRRFTGLTAKEQRVMAKAIKCSHNLALLPYLSKYPKPSDEQLELVWDQDEVEHVTEMEEEYGEGIVSDLLEDDGEYDNDEYHIDEEDEEE